MKIRIRMFPKVGAGSVAFLDKSTMKNEFFLFLSPPILMSQTFAIYLEMGAFLLVWFADKTQHLLVVVS